MGQPRYNFFNLGQALKDHEAIKSARLKNQAAGLANEEMETAKANREKANKIKAAIEETPNQIEELERQGLFDEANQMRESYVKQQTAGVRWLESMREGLNADNYKPWRERQIKMGSFDPEFLPVEYSDDWFRKGIDKGKSSLSKLTRKWSDEQGNVYAQDIVSQDGTIMWEGSAYDPNKAKGGQEGSYQGMKSGDSNSIRNAAAMLYGGLYDPTTGQFSGLSPTKAQDVATLSAEAARIYDANGGRLPHDQAVARAARKLGMESVKDVSQVPEPGSDPLGLLNK